MTEAHSAPATLRQAPAWMAGLVTLQQPRHPPLTAREIDIATHVGRGLSSKLIGHCLGISEHTVRKHRENIARKLRLRNAAELAAWSSGQLRRPHSA